MRISRTQNRIRELMSIFVTEMKGAPSQNDTNVNHLAEEVILPLFKIVYGWSALRNLNESEHRNFPAIDLADDDARIAIQVTATPDSEKVKETLRTFIAHRFYEKYDRLIVYVLTEKQQSYSGSGFVDILDGKFTFDKDGDIWDFRDFLGAANGLEFNAALRIEHILDGHFGDERAGRIQFSEAAQTEEVFLNLLEVTLPGELFVAQLAVDRDEVKKESAHLGIRLSYRSTERDIVRAAMEQRNVRFGTDWISHEGKIITFHDLSDSELPLYHVIDPGTVERFSPDSFYGIDEDYDRVFKQLLWRTLQQRLFHLGIRWQHEDKLFIFCDVDGESLRKESWQGRNRGERMVYQRVMKTYKPDEVLRHEHFGFRIPFKRFGATWYGVIVPEWYASYDGYHKDTFGNFVEWKKRNENNQHVSSHARFIAYFLVEHLNSHPPTLFEAEFPSETSFLKFGDYISFDNAPALDDNAFLPSKKGELSKPTSESETDDDEYMQVSFLDL